MNKTGVGTFYFQVRHANNFNGFPLEILDVPTLFAAESD